MPGGIVAIIEWLFLALGLIMVTLPSVYYRAPWLALVILSMAFSIRKGRTRQIFPRTDINTPWLLFILSAAWGAWISVVPAQAQIQFTRLLAAYVLFCALTAIGYHWKRRLVWVWLGCMALLALYWPVSYTFSSSPKFGLITRVGAAINAVLPSSFSPVIPANVTGGMLALTVPFGVALALLYWRKKRRDRVYLALSLTVIILVSLVLTSSYGAMLGLLAAGGFATLALVQTRWFGGWRQKVVFWGAVGLAILILFLGLSASGLVDRLVGAMPDPSGSLLSRVEIWRQGLPLIQDYFFTGAGLETFPIVFSVYRLLIHVPFHEHLHNIFLEAWFEQGILGLVAMLWGMAAVLKSAWKALTPSTVTPWDARYGRRSSLRILGWAGMAALLAMGVHGMVDVVFMVKASLPVVGLVLGYVTLVDTPTGQSINEAPATSRLGRRGRWGIAAAIVGAALLAVMIYPPLRATWYLNMGALSQTRTELSRYNPNMFDRPTLDRIRRQVDLSKAQGNLEKYLSYTPNGRTALQRLALISISRRDYESARTLLEQNDEAGWNDPATRLLYGDILVADGQIAEAADVLRGLPWAVDRLLFQAWFRYWLYEDYERATNAWKTVLLLEPYNRNAWHYLEQNGD